MRSARRHWAPRFAAPSKVSTREPIRRVILTHYHADHFYGLGSQGGRRRCLGAQGGARVPEGGEAERRREQRARDLFPWVDEKMAIVAPDRWLDDHAEFTLGKVRFEVHYLGPPTLPRT
jgi:glyoxylase-like metal-dependent hydrolase (beta-lactamase superfamily II)